MFMMMMNTMACEFIQLFVATICIGLALGEDPTAQFRIKKVDIKIIDNPYFDSWSYEIHAPGETVSIKTPVKKDVPANMMMKGVIEFGGSQVGEFDITLCEAFKDEAFGKDLLAAGIPKNKFPKACPCKANGEYAIGKYTFPRSKIPPGLPDGIATAEISLYEPGKDPYVTISGEVELTHKVPGIGR